MLAVCFQAWRGKETPSHVTVSPPIMTTAECVQVLKDIDGGKRLEDEWDERVLRRLLLDPPPSDFVVAKALRDGATQPVKRAPKTSSSSRPPMLHEKRRASLTMALSFRSSLFVQRQTVGGDTPLHIAADEGNLDEVRRLLKEGWDPNAQNLRQQTPLHLAARHYASEFLPVVGVLVECGASVSMKDKEGYTASQVCVCARAPVVRGITPVFDFSASKQLATSEAIMFVLGQHITRLNNLQFTSYERSMYRKRATLKWLPNVSFSRLMPAFAGWLLATKHK
jgi:Ankyrin repeats (many copies)